MFIDGRWIKRQREIIESLSPAYRLPQPGVLDAREEDIDRACEAAARALHRDNWSSLDERIDCLDRLYDLIREHRNKFAWTICREIGAPIDLARRHQVGAAMGQLATVIKTLKRFRWEVPVRNRVATKVYQPIGVCGLITPWNWPLLQSIAKLAPALGCGCTVVHKPSEFATQTAILLTELIHKAGFPAGVFNLVTGRGDCAGRSLVAHTIPRMISFTGSTATGVNISQIAAATVKRVTLELGGKSPNLIFADSNTDRTVPRGVRACFSHSGQSCNAPSRMLVEQSVYKKAISVAHEVASHITVGNPTQPGKQLGPLVNKAQYDRVQALIHSAIDQGATLIAGGLGRPDGFTDGYYVRPTIFADVNCSMRIVREEVFGPVLCMEPFDNEDHAVQLANNTNYGLSAYINTQSTERAYRIARRLEVGMVHINCAKHSARAPFGGVKQSGNGREYGEEGLLEYLEVKTISG